MAGQLPDITKIGQSALALPTDIINAESAHVQNALNVANKNVAALGLPPLPAAPSAAALTPPPLPGVGGLALPPLPGLPGAAAPAPSAEQLAIKGTAATVIKGERVIKPQSYAEY